MYYYDIIFLCQHGGIGRRTGLKIQRWQHRAGSTPAAGILQSFKKDSRLISSLFSFIKQINVLAILLYKILAL